MRHRAIRAATITAVVAAAAVTTASCTTEPSAPVSVAWNHAPEQYRQAISTAIGAHGCNGVTEDVIAAQIYKDSNFTAVESPRGTRGPAQLFPSQWDRFAPQVGATDINSPTDATKVLVLVNCDNVNELMRASIDPTLNNVMMAYVAGPRSVIRPNPALQRDIHTYLDPYVAAASPA